LYVFSVCDTDYCNLNSALYLCWYNTNDDILWGRQHNKAFEFTCVHIILLTLALQHDKK